MPVPSELTFLHTNNPYEDEENSGFAAEGDTSFITEDGGRYEDRTAENEYELAQATYPAYATHGLEALSAVASQDQLRYAPPPAPMSQHDQESNQHSNAATTKDLEYILNPATAGASSNPNIDPRLHSEQGVSQPEQTGSAPQQSAEQVCYYPLLREERFAHSQ